MPIEGLAGNLESSVLPTQTVSVSPASIPVVSSVASALSSATTAIKNAVSGKASLGNTKLPLPNPFWKYSSYNYIFTLFCVDANGYNNPDSTYMKGKGNYPIILRSGSGAPNNRINTDLGKFDFFMDDVTIKCKYGFDAKTGNSHAAEMQFTIYEPFSMGIFMMSVQEAAYKMNYPNYVAANFVLAIQFMGEDQSGSMSSIPNTTKYFTFKFSEQIRMEVDNGGAKYFCKTQASSESALLHSNIKLSSEISFAGRTVQEVLQTHPESFTAIYNRRLKEVAKSNGFYPDEIVILFPTDISSASGTSTTSTPASSNAPTAAPATSNTEQDLLKIVGVTRSGMTDALVQASPVNGLGKSLLGVGPSREGLPQSFGAKIYDEATHSYDQSAIQKDVTLSTYQLQQNHTVVDAINQVLLSSQYAAAVLSTDSNDTGMRKMWNIVPSEYHIDTNINDSKTGRKPRLLVYRVYPYDVLATTQPLPGQKLPKTKYDALLAQCAKAYDYIYTGKNTDIINLQLKFNQNFSAVMANDNYRRGADTAEGGNSLKQQQTDIVFSEGTTNNNPAKGVNNLLNFIGTTTKTNLKGGGPNDTEAHRAARFFFDAMMYGKDMEQLEMTIHGDPYWLASSGTGNYRAKETQYANLNTDLSVNIHNGEVHTIIRFRTPTDINSTGLYNLNGSKALLQYSGIYKVMAVDHMFKDGAFTQLIQANKTIINPSDTQEIVYNTKKTIPKTENQASADDTPAPPKQ